jgi:membrane protease YdiL (CAAX protease family)
MGDKQGLLSLYGKSPLYQLIVSMLIILGAGIILFSVFLLVGMQIFDADPDLFTLHDFAVKDEDVSFLRYLLIIQDISLFIVPGIIIFTLMRSGRERRFSDSKIPGILDVGLIVVLAFCIFPVTSFTGQLNAGLNLPEWLSGIENWITEKEENASQLIDTLIISDTSTVLIWNLIIIAVIPAIGEELIFRGVLQKILYGLFKSPHVAILVTSLVFSAIHFQFYGFIPRIILGLVFGYLFFWSGTLWLPVISHFVNNAVPVIGAYLEGWDKLNVSPDASLAKQVISLPLPIIISILILIYFRKRYKKRSYTGMDNPVV